MFGDRLNGTIIVCVVSILVHVSLYYNAHLGTSHRSVVCPICVVSSSNTNTSATTDTSATNNTIGVNVTNATITRTDSSATPHTDLVRNDSIAGSTGIGVLSNITIINNDIDGHEHERVAVIVETRAIPFLITTIEHFMSVLGMDWFIQVWYAPSNEAYLRDNDFIRTNIQQRRLALMPLGHDYKAAGRTWYSCLLSQNVSFWNAIGGKHILIFQLDSCLCVNSPLKIDHFLSFDYIGAPWAPYVQRRDGRGGNGGLSLRSSRAMKMCAIEQSLHPLTECPNEDGLITDCLIRHLNDTSPSGSPLWRLPLTREESMPFAVETVYYPTPWGLHKPWPYLSRPQVTALQTYCPPLTRVIRGA